MFQTGIILSKPTPIFDHATAKIIFPLHTKFNSLIYSEKLRFWEEKKISIECGHLHIWKNENDKKGVGFSIIPTNDEEREQYANYVLKIYEQTLEDRKQIFFETLEKYKSKKSKLEHVQKQIEGLVPPRQIAPGAIDLEKRLNRITSIDRYRDYKSLPDFKKMDADLSNNFARLKNEVDYKEFLEDQHERIVNGRNLSERDIEDDLPSINPLQENQKVMLLYELGVFDFLLEKYSLNDNYKKLAQIVESFSGIKQETIRQTYRAIIGVSYSEKNNPYNNSKNIEFLNNSFNQFGITRKEKKGKS